MAVILASTGKFLCVCVGLRSGWSCADQVFSDLCCLSRYPTCPILLWPSFYITNAKLMFLVMQTLGVFMAPVMF